MKQIISIIILMIGLSLGCPQAQVMAQGQRPLVDYVENIRQAEDILRPQRKDLMITRDPFDPIVVPTFRGSTLGNTPQSAALAEDNLDDMQVIGTARLGDESRAYITIGSKPSVISVQDKIRKFTVTRIDWDQVVLKSGDKIITKKRGKS